MALAILAEARRRGLTLSRPEAPTEAPGEGLRGRIDGLDVVIGSPAFAGGARAASGAPPDLAAGEAAVGLSVSGRYVGTLVLADPLRPDVKETLEALRRLGVARIVLATGDRAAISREVSAGLPIDAVAGDLLPGDKVDLVSRETASGLVMMIGDGVNDAPALAAAHVGAAMGARGAAAAAETADVVVLRDRLAPIAAAVWIAQRTRAIALQSVLAGIGLSTAGMLIAAIGWLDPIEGAFLQEAIDVAAVLNALRVLRLSPPPPAGSASAAPIPE